MSVDVHPIFLELVTSNNDNTSVAAITSNKPSLFITQTKELLNSISQLKDFILRHREAYLNASIRYFDNAEDISEFDRDKIDDNTSYMIKLCHDLLSKIKLQPRSKSSQISEHENAVLELIESYLKKVCNIYSEQRAVRVNVAIETRNTQKLENSVLRHRIQPKSQNSSIVEGPHKVVENPTTLSKEEMQIFADENKRLFDEFSSMAEEVRHVESQVVEISKLQHLFTEKVLEQQEQLDHLEHTVMHTTENIKEGNEFVREAIRNNAGLRFWILFFLIICSFSLLFLDWYDS